MMKRFYRFIVSNFAKQDMNIKGLGIDTSIYMVNIGNKLARKNGVDDRVKFQLGNSRNLPEQSFKLAYSTLSFHHWADREKALINILAHLKDVDSSGSMNLIKTNFILRSHL